MIRFFAPEIEIDGVLPETESGHCCRVLRMKEGDTLYAVDGKGHSFECVITEADSKHTHVGIVNKTDEPKVWSPSITVAVAPTKNIDRIEWFVEKAVEIGIDRLVLLKCDRSERKDVKTERLNKIVISAMKQSMKAVAPELIGMMPFRNFVGQAFNGEKYMGYCSNEFPRLELVKEYSPGSDVTILIGPEGDFSPAEVEQATSAGFIPVTFGQTRLRTETAALYSLSAIHVINNLSN